MVLKIIGSVMIIISAGLSGFYYGNLESYRIADLLEMKKALTILKSEIEFSINTLPQAFVNISARVKNPAARLFARIGDGLANGPGAGLAAVWEDCVGACQKESYFNDDDIAQIKSFGKTLGYLDVDMQLANIRMLTEYIDQRVKELEISCAKNKKLFNSLGVLGGLLVVVLLA